MMRSGIDSYCYHRFFGDVYPDQEAPVKNMTISAFLDRAKELGVQAVSLESSFFRSLDKSYVLELKSLLDGFDFDRVFSWGHPAGLEGGESTERFEELKATIPLAKLMGAPIMQVIGGDFAKKGDSHEGQVQRLTEQLKEAVKVAADNDVKLALENHGDLSVQEILDVVEGVASPNLGVSFDTGNFIRLLDDPVKAAELLGRYVLTVHLKDVQVNTKEARPSDQYFFACVPVGQGLVDNESVLNALHRAGYEGFVGADMDHPHFDWYGREDEAVELSVRAIRDLLAQI